jgi:hypothetical protein
MPYRYQNTQKDRVDGVGKEYFLNNIYPDIPIKEGDSYVITTLGDRLDLLALDFYSDTTDWWIIASANGLPGDSLYPPIGMQLRIPANPQEIRNQYRLVNATR